MNKLIVCADDYGLTYAINRGIENSIEKGIVRCVSVFPDGKYSLEAKMLIEKYPNVELGIHLLSNKDFETQFDSFYNDLGIKPVYAALHWSSKYKKLTKRETYSLAFTLKVFCKRHKIYLRGSRSNKNFALNASVQSKDTVKKLISIIGKVKGGISELVVHPGDYPDYELNSSYQAVLRANETAALTNEVVLNKIKREEISLTTFSILRR